MPDSANTMLGRADVEDFLYLEADCLDRWALDEWLGLWAPSGEIDYQVAPTGEDDVAELEPTSAMFLIADDRYRLEQRIVRMKKDTFHAEFVRSRTRHMYGHVRIIGQDADALDALFNSTVHRTQKGITVAYPSQVRTRLTKTEQGLRLVKKRMELDLDNLRTIGALTILL